MAFIAVEEVVEWVQGVVCAWVVGVEGAVFDCVYGRLDAGVALRGGRWYD